MFDQTCSINCSQYWDVGFYSQLIYIVTIKKSPDGNSFHSGNCQIILGLVVWARFSLGPIWWFDEIILVTLAPSDIRNCCTGSKEDYSLTNNLFLSISERRSPLFLVRYLLKSIYVLHNDWSVNWYYMQCTTLCVKPAI